MADLERIEAIKKHIEEDHAPKVAAFMKSLMYGGVDGVIVVSSVVASAAGADESLKVLVILGISALIADAFSMGFSDWLSGSAERTFYLSELSKEEEEYKVHREEEINELSVIYQDQGMTKADANELVGLLASKPEYTDVFLKHMMMQELNMADSGDYKNITAASGYTAAAVLFCGGFPIMTYVIFYAAGAEADLYVHLCALLACATTLFFTGWLGCKISRQPYLRQSTLNTINGTCAIVLAYFIGLGLDSIL